MKTARMSSLIWIFAGLTCHFISFAMFRFFEKFISSYTCAGVSSLMSRYILRLESKSTPNKKKKKKQNSTKTNKQTKKTQKSKTNKNTHTHTKTKQKKNKTKQNKKKITKTKNNNNNNKKKKQKKKKKTTTKNNNKSNKEKQTTLHVSDLYIHQETLIKWKCRIHLRLEKPLKFWSFRQHRRTYFLLILRFILIPP